MGASLMIVGDDFRVRDTLRLAMEQEGYEVAEAGAAEVALERLRSNGAPDVMIVDMLVGEMDAFTCIREVRRAHEVPIMVVSASEDTHDVVAALEAGADDFVTKPFEIKEISARMRALRRRPRLGALPDDPMSDPPAEIVLDADDDAPLVLSPDGGVVRRGDEQIPLTITEFRLLCELAANPGRVLSRTLLLERAWDEGFFGDERLVDVHIRRLRTKIESDSSDPRIVVTVRGLGYRLDMPK
ncbi:response regulator [Nocardia sp. ET3-3]|uniref:Response regulator n=1 Tax=Nocardia terrae TaxID=2675851 RepID=A0A7K1VB69_9NOCA|nr:response regulator transcription factor [Nocardia terrae]MVU83890.1 response regulator [Nocardia terrae]